MSKGGAPPLELEFKTLRRCILNAQLRAERVSIFFPEKTF